MVSNKLQLHHHHPEHRYLTLVDHHPEHRHLMFGISVTHTALNWRKLGTSRKREHGGGASMKTAARVVILGN